LPPALLPSTMMVLEVNSSALSGQHSAWICASASACSCARRSPAEGVLVVTQ
jgi:hypothetical protein